MSRPRRWLSAFGRHEWDTDDSTYAGLMDALTRDRVESEALDREMSAPAHPGVTDVKQLEHAELEEARRELAAFRWALDNMHQRTAGSERAEVPYDSSKPNEDQAADVLIQYLVRPGYAEVRTEEPQPGRYVYYVRIDWPKLREFASQQGHPLPY
jgi:hypothetical protein